MKLSWWKYLAILLLCYVFIAGMLVPLGPGIVDSHPLQSNVGKELKMEVVSYNMPEDSDLSAYLRIDSFLLKASTIQQSESDNNLITLNFTLPGFLPVPDSQRDAALILFHPSYGAAVLPTAIFLKQTDVNIAVGRKAWLNDDILSGVDLVGKTHFPYRSILEETIRNTYFHVPMWFTMIVMFTISVVLSILFLRSGEENYDTWIVNLNRVGVLFGILGIVTGAIWATYTWGEPWSSDIKQNMAAICLLIYGGYFVLRAAVEDIDKKRRITAVFNIFAYMAMIPLLFVIPRMTDSLHPGSGGNPAMGSQDLDNTMRMVFYPAVIAWILLGLWISELSTRYVKVKLRVYKKLQE